MMHMMEVDDMESGDLSIEVSWSQQKPLKPHLAQHNGTVSSDLFFRMHNLYDIMNGSEKR